MKLQIGAIGLQATRDDVAVCESSLVPNDDVCKGCNDSRAPLGPREGALLVGSGTSPRKLRRAWRRRQLHRARAFENDKRAALVVRLSVGVEEIPLVVRRGRGAAR